VTAQRRPGTVTVMSDLTIELAPSTSPRTAEERAALLQDPGFGQVFTDHMVTASYSRDEGWHGARLTAYEPLVLDPATSVLHYGQAIFEGLKAYHQPDGSVALFRPDQNAGRFRRSARRLAMAELPDELFLESLHALVRADRDWVPTRPGESLYLRPLMIATDPFLGVRPSFTYRYLLFASPAANYFPGGVHPVSVWLSTEYVRAAPGGTGEAKCAGNYAASLVAQAQAAEQGCDQVVWLDAIEHRWVEEMGGMNLYFVRADGRLVTPALTGTLLPGVTRDSILALGRDQHPGVGGGLRRRLHHRGLRLRHRGRRHPGRRGQARRRVVHGGRRRLRRGDDEDPRGAARHPAGDRAGPARLAGAGRLSGRAPVSGAVAR
jgi:branched-chain amino acid aminotransferase